MQRRHFTALLGATLAAPWSLPARARTDAMTRSMLALAWRGPAETDSHHAGRVQVDWSAGSLRIAQAVPLPGRPHGLLAEDDGSLLVVAMRPGRWLLRIAPQGQVTARRSMDDEPDGHRLDGHVIASVDGRHLLTTQTDPRTGQGFVAVRDHATLDLLDRWPTHGIDPHQLLLDRDGALMVANGGIPRDAQGRKRDVDRMAPSLVRLSGRDGRLLGRWALPDARLSIRHMAWSQAEGDASPRLGLALQAEHDDATARQVAPLLAVFEQERLRAAPVPPGGAGYAGDIAATPDGGFMLSAQRAGRVLHWQPVADAPWRLAGQIGDACALAPAARDDDALVMLGARGIGRWHPEQPAQMLPWPQPMAVDNHCVVWTTTHSNAAAPTT
jgi:hypothetical protein